MSSDREGSRTDSSVNEIGNDVDDSRRGAIVRLAKYTAPAMLALLLSEKAMAGTSAAPG